MTTTHYIARARDGRNLELQEEAQSLGLKAGDQVSIIVEMEEDTTPEVVPNFAALEALARIDEILRFSPGFAGEKSRYAERPAKGLDHAVAGTTTCWC